jgi:D-arabinose 1-dehydrogenase-like Zn-dependent alcohol dehydrogenase
VCRTDLHVIDSESPHIHYPLVPGHEIVGIVEGLGPGPGHFGDWAAGWDSVVGKDVWALRVLHF